MHLKWVKQTFPRHDDLSRLLLNWQCSDECCNFLCRLPFSKLSKPFLPCPHRSVDDLQEQLSSARVEDEDGAVDWFRRQVALESLVDSNTVHVRIVDKPDDLVREQFSVVLSVQVRLSWFRRVQLQSFADTFSKHVQCRVGFHDLIHGLQNKALHVREPVAECRVQIVRQINSDQVACWTRVDADVVCRVVQELGSCVPFDIVRIVIAPS